MRRCAYYYTCAITLLRLFARVKRLNNSHGDKISPVLVSFDIDLGPCDSVRTCTNAKRIGFLNYWFYELMYRYGRKIKKVVCIFLQSSNVINFDMNVWQLFKISKLYTLCKTKFAACIRNFRKNLSGSFRKRVQNSKKYSRNGVISVQRVIISVTFYEHLNITVPML